MFSANLLQSVKTLDNIECPDIHAVLHCSFQGGKGGELESSQNLCTVHIKDLTDFSLFSKVRRIHPRH